MRRGVSSTVVLLALLLVSSAEAAERTVRGRVIDERTGAGVAGARVELFPIEKFLKTEFGQRRAGVPSRRVQQVPPAGRATSDKRGQFALQTSAEGLCMIACYSRQGTAQQTIAIPTSKTPIELKVRWP